jgi:hypothetical protein
VGSGFSRIIFFPCLGKLKFWVFARDFVSEDMGSLLLALGCRSAVAAATVTRSIPSGYVALSSSSSHKHMHCVSTFVSKRSIIKLGLVPDLAAIRAPTRCRNWVPCRATGGEEEGHDQVEECNLQLPPFEFIKLAVLSFLCPRSCVACDICDLHRKKRLCHQRRDQQRRLLSLQQLK